jgi:lipopolysaccharide export system permease protein
MAFIVTLIVSLFLVPYGNAATRDLLFVIIKQKASIGIKENVFNDDFKGILLYAEKIPVDGNFLEGVLVSDNRISKEPSTIIAKKAYLLSDPNSLTITLRLEDGSTHTVDKNLRNYRKMDFSSYDVNLALESSIAQEEKISKKDSEEMTIWEIANTLRRSGINSIALRELAVEFNKKISIPFSCIIFGILGIPLGIRAHRSVKSRGFSIGLLTVLIYYVLQIGVEALAEAGNFSPFIGIWLPNITFSIAAIYFFTMASREKPFIPKWLNYHRKITT